MTNPHTSPLRRPEDMPPVRNQSELEHHWRTLMGKLGFGERQLWVSLFDDAGRCAPVLPQIVDLPDIPERQTLDNLMWMCHELVGEGGSAAFLFARPGPAGLTAVDRAWASGLAETGRRSPLRVHQVHVANDQDLRVFAPDDEIASA